ncbi:MAG: M48 family metallopeptidase [Chloroflexi bacterium]|nr:M48 family metallopeptidase [Chloroflexota bacterium]
MWEQIRDNQVRSVILVTVLGFILILLGSLLGQTVLGDWSVGLLLALLVWIVMTLVGYFQGDSILLSISKARKIGPDDLPRVYNVVEEMKIACGLEKMPDIYIVDDPAMNAFATGRDKNHASVTVTSGLLQKLNRDELQGVVGHEMAHIRNRDVLLMAMCSILLGTIVMLAWYGSRILFFGGGTRRSSSGGGSAQIIILLVAIVLMIFAPIMAQFIYLAISRKREYLADASSALYTRYPEGLASALEKIAASTEQIKSANNATAPMYILNPFRKGGRVAEDLSSTHPPTSERIRILRSMAGNVSLAGYESAYNQSHKGGGGIIPGSALAAVNAAVQSNPATPGIMPAEKERAREASDALWKLNKYREITCNCGLKFKIPPDFHSNTFNCPRCGTVHSLQHR